MQDCGTPNDILAPRMARFAPSATLAMSRRANELQAEGADVIKLSSGEPDFDTPMHIREAAMQAIADGRTKSTSADGMPELKEAVQRKFKSENGLSFAIDEICIGAGAKQVIFNALLASVSDGDEVVIPAPYWVSYPDIVRLAGGTPVFVPSRPEHGFVLQPDDLERSITKRTKWLVINNPSNPSGAVWDRDSLRQIADVLIRHPQVWILTDDIYEHLVYDNSVVKTFASVAPELRDRTVTTNGVSKAYCMSGWRIGFAGGPAPVIKAMVKLQSQETSASATVSQHAALAALNGPKDFIADHVARFVARRDLVVKNVNAIEGLSCRTPRGAFYVFADCSALFGRRAAAGPRISSDVDFAEYLLNDHGVAVVPGSAFGIPSHFRISYSVSDDVLGKACARIAGAVGQLSA